MMRRRLARIAADVHEFLTTAMLDGQRLPLRQSPTGSAVSGAGLGSTGDGGEPLRTTSGETNASEPDLDLPPAVVCWRCGRYTPETGACQHCGARRGPVAKSSAGAVETTPLHRMFVISGLLVLTSLILGWLTALSGGSDTGPEFLLRCGWVEGIDTLLVLAGLFWIRPAAASTDAVAPRPLLAWCIAWPLLGAMLLLNRTYHTLLLEFIDSPLLVDPFPEAERYVAWYIVVICLQPAVVEELFFRQTVMQSLRGILSLHGAVWIGATMFGLAHLGQALSLPYLILLGGVLGYLRLLSGGLLLPMLLHFVHNGYVLWAELTS